MYSEFLERNYVEPLIRNGYIRVDTMSIPDGTYYKMFPLAPNGLPYPNVGQSILVHERICKYNSGLDYTFYNIITNNGIRGALNGQPIEIKDGLPVGEDVYCIMSIRNVDLLRYWRDKKIDEITNVH